jgi:hypothetical protein
MTDARICEVGTKKVPLKQGPKMKYELCHV